MKYAARLTIPFSTPESTPVSTEVNIPEKWLTGYSITFPPGCGALAGIKIVVDGLQVAPARGSSDSWFRGEGVITWIGRYKMASGNPGGSRVVIEGYNDDDTYNHTPLIFLDGSNE